MSDPKGLWRTIRVFTLLSISTDDGEVGNSIGGCCKTGPAPASQPSTAGAQARGAGEVKALETLRAFVSPDR